MYGLSEVLKVCIIFPNFDVKIPNLTQKIPKFDHCHRYCLEIKMLFAFYESCLFNLLTRAIWKVCYMVFFSVTD